MIGEDEAKIVSIKKCTPQMENASPYFIRPKLMRQILINKKQNIIMMISVKQTKFIIYFYIVL